MSSTPRLQMAVVALLGIVAGCIGAAVGRAVDAPPVDIAVAQQARPTNTPAAPITATASGRPNVAAPLPPYPPNSAAPRWQQWCVQSYDHNINMTMKAYGDQGWEFVSGDGYTSCFRRPAP